MGQEEEQRKSSLGQGTKSLEKSTIFVLLCSFLSASKQTLYFVVKSFLSFLSFLCVLCALVVNLFLFPLPLILPQSLPTNFSAQVIISP